MNRGHSHAYYVFIINNKPEKALPQASNTIFENVCSTSDNSVCTISLHCYSVIYRYWLFHVRVRYVQCSRYEDMNGGANVKIGVVWGG